MIALKGLSSALQLSSYISQEKTCQQAPVHQEKETADDAGHATATEEIKSGHRGDMQGGPPSTAPAEPPAGPVSTAAGTYDEPPGEDDPASLCHVSNMEPERGQGTREAMRCSSWKRLWSCFTDCLVETKT